MNPADRDRAGEVLGRAFTNDPLWAAILPDDEARPARLTRMFSDLTRTVAGAGGAPLTAELDAVALWLPPGRNLGIWPMAKSGFALVRSSMAWPRDDRKRMMKVLRQMDGKRKRLVPEPHWYLLALGTDPDSQGRGLGSALVRSGTQQADRAGTNTYLETETAGNVRFYEQLGFEVLEEITAEGLDLPIWLMLRQPDTLSARQ